MVLKKFGYPDKVVNFIKQLHGGLMERIISDDNVSDPFPIINGVKQGCILAPFLFGLYFTTILMDVPQEENNIKGIYIKYHLDSKVFNLCWLQAPIKVKQELICELLFAKRHGAHGPQQRGSGTARGAVFFCYLLLQAHSKLKKEGYGSTPSR